MISTLSELSRRRPPGWDAAKTAVQAAFAGLWGAGFSVLGVVRRERAVVNAPVGGGRILVLAPHPDDEVVGCGGTVLLHKAAGAQVAIAYATDGRRSRALGLDPATMAVTRQQEAERAAVVLGVDHVEWCGLPEGAWTGEELADRLRQLMDRWAPEIVYAPSRVDFHPEHHRVAHALAHALATTVGANPSVRVFQVQVPLGASLVNRVVDIASVDATHRSALMAHVSQRGATFRSLRLKRYAGRAHRLVGLAEEFWELSAEAYSGLHRGDPDDSGAAYRGFRYLSLTDPAAYLVGRSVRRDAFAAAGR